MSASELNIDPILLAEFIDESVDMLATVDPLFVQLEAEPGNLQPIEAIFRPVHSIKGNSAFFGFVHVKQLAHEMETLLDQVRKNQLAVSQTLIDVLLEGVDALRGVFDRVRNGEPEVLDEEPFSALVERVKDAGGGEAARQSSVLEAAVAKLQALQGDAAITSPDARKRLGALASDLAALLPRADDGEEAGPVAGPLQELRGLVSDPIEGTMPEDRATQVGGALAALESDAATDAARALIADTRDTYQTFMDTVGFDDLLREMLFDKVKEMAALGPEAWGSAPAAQPAGPAADEPSAAPADAPSAADAAQHKHADKTMRVSESHIDTFLAFVGEMLVVGDMFHHLQRRVDAELNGSDISASFRRTNETFANLSNDLQRSIMSIRRVAVRSLLQKVPRMVRDIAAHSGKDIAVTVTGEDVEVDKSLIDLLDAPLTHMVRNAADHGIESPEAREAAGKPGQGQVRVDVTETPDMVVVSVSDDGGGLNLDAIRSKAEALELVKPGQELREQDIVNLLFSSGVSTAAAVTDVSGRGVGMDVVRRMIEEAGGKITVSTEAGTGSAFAVHVPKSVTTQIMPGFLVRTGGQVFVLSLDRVRETTKVGKEELESVTGKGRVVKLHGAILPVVSFGESMSIDHMNGSRDFEVLVTVEAFKQQFALSVDEVIGVQQVVLRTIDGLETTSPSITGGALLGDGSVALIVDVERMLDRRD